MMRVMSVAMGLRGMDVIRKAAAPISISLEMKKRFSSDLIIRKNYSTTSSIKGSLAAAKEKKVGKCLYLCFVEGDWPKTIHSIESVRLSHVLAQRPRRRSVRRSYDVEKNVLELEQVAVRKGLHTRVPDHVSSTVIGGSKIVLSGGWLNRNRSNVCGFQTPRDPTVHPRRAFKPLPMIKNSLFLAEVDGRLYRFGPGFELKMRSYYCNACEFFEVFDDKDGQGKWLPLDMPTTDTLITTGVPPISFTYAVAGTNILIWAIDHPGVGVSRFDVSHPENGWTQLYSDLGDCIPSLGPAQILFLKLHPDRDRGRGFLMFSYNAEYGKPNLQVFLVSHDCDSLKPMESVPLPEFVLLFGARGGRFFHIQDQKFGLVLFRPKWLALGYYEKVRVAVITYEYEVITTEDDHEALEVKYKLLSTCFLDTVPYENVDLVGAYVL